ncbi:MAG: hypothetical protein ACU843_13285 [Gammaproteobacteria bacterium]
MKRLSSLLLMLAMGFLPFPSLASDHADPLWLDTDQAEANITGLFFFPEGDQMITILNIRRALTEDPPYNLEPYEYTIYMDLDSKVTFDNAEDVARYGGTVVNPDTIGADVSLTFQLNNDATLKSKVIKGLKDPDAIRVYTGVRDDPFIFPRFFKTNVISMVASIPMTSFLDSQKNWLLWAVTRERKSGKQIDHVGRSNRTQLGRFDILNTVPPYKHVATLRDANKSREKIQKFLANCLPPIASLNQLSGFRLRHYDFVPDVMVYTNQRAPGYPNGRQLTDDIAFLSCQQGDCPLQENAFIDTEQWPRQTVNDKPFLSDFPYLAEPWPARPAPPAPSCWPYILKYVVPVLVILVLLIGLPIWYCCKRCCRRRRA